MKEAALDGSTLDARREGALVAVTVSVPKLGYTRKTLLRDWESEYLFERLGPKRRVF